MLNNIVVDPAYSHAVEEHPNSAPIVRTCMENKGPFVQFQIRKGQRYLRVCAIDDSTFGFQIVDRVGKVFKERTAYIKDNCVKVKEVFDYARKQGFPKFTGDL